MAAHKLSKQLLEVLCCPMDKTELVYDSKAQTLTCKKCKFIYPVREGIPVLLPPELQAKKDVERSRKSGWKG